MSWLYAPDSYGGFLTAPQAARLVPASWRRHPMSDGGEGLLAALCWHRPEHSRRRARVPDVSGDARDVFYLDGPDGFLIESAAVVGPVAGMVPPRQRTTEGLGILLASLLPAGRPITIGLGGSATIDAGLGVLRGLGAGHTGARLHSRHGPLTLPALDLSQVVVWCDVQTPLRSCMARFGPQKGLLPAEIPGQSAAALRWATALNAARAARGLSPLSVDLPGGGAAGGLGFALAAMGARLVAGAAAFADATALDAAIAGADGVILGEGRLDETSYEGKVAATVTQRARRAGKPVAALVGCAQGVPPPPEGPDQITLIGEQDIRTFRAAARALQEALR